MFKGKDTGSRYLKIKYEIIRLQHLNPSVDLLVQLDLLSFIQFLRNPVAQGD